MSNSKIQLLTCQVNAKEVDTDLPSGIDTGILREGEALVFVAERDEHGTLSLRLYFEYAPTKH